MTDSPIFYAPSVGVGGGLVLVRSILRQWAGRSRLKAILDERGREAIGDIARHHDVRWVRSTLLGRLRAERMLAAASHHNDVILCFHNVPPVLPVAGRVICFVQNGNLVGLVPLGNVSNRMRSRIRLQKLIARMFSSRVDQYVVQTPSMAAALATWFGPRVPPIHVIPFLDIAELKKEIEDSEATPKKWDFLYVSDGTAHKNHRRLFQAWRLLGERGDFPSLALTLHPERDALLRHELDDLVQKYGLRIEDIGQMPHAQLLDTYQQAGALLFPSYAESFGIPLIEAAIAGLPILAPELDYVRDMCDPVETFDPHSERSIARAVRRFLYGGSDKVIIGTPVDFMKAIIRLGDIDD